MTTSYTHFLDLAVCALILSSAAGMLGANAVRSCGVKRAAVYQRWRPQRTLGL